MDNKTKVKVAVVIGIIFLAVIFIFMVVFVKGNKPQKNKNIPTKGEEGYVDPTQKSSDDSNTVIQNPGDLVDLNDVTSIGIKNGNLVKIHKDLTSTDVRKMESGYTEMCYGDSKIYAVINNEDGTISIIEIDLSRSNYPEKTIMTTNNYGVIHNMEYYFGKLYFVSQVGQLIEYSISENYSRAITNANEVTNFTINKSSNNMLVSYCPNEQNAGVYIYDFTANSFSQIIALTQLPGQLVLNGNHLVIDVKELGSLYIFDMESNSVVGIGPESNTFEQIADQIAFYDNVLLYTNGAAIDIKKISGESYQDSWYTLNDGSIAGILMLDSGKMQISRRDSSGSGKVTRSIVIDLATGATTEVPDYAYTDVINL